MKNSYYLQESASREVVEEEFIGAFVQKKR